MRTAKAGYSKGSFGVYILLIGTVAMFFLASGGKVSPSHLLNIVRQAAPLGIAAIGQTLVLLMGGIDLSAGAVMSLVNILATSIMAGSSQNVFAGVMVCLAASALIGLINGVIVTKFKMPPFLITMAMSTVIQGIMYVYTKGVPKGGIPDSFRVISEGWLGPVPVAGLVWLGIWGLCSFLLYKTPYGRRFYITGGNPRTSLLSGFFSGWISVSAYVLCSLLAGAAGLMLSAYIGVPSMGVGDSYTLNTIASAVIGGTVFSGGTGTLEGTFPGVLIMMLLQSMLTIMNISEAGKCISQGVVIAVMVAWNQRKK